MNISHWDDRKLRNQFLRQGQTSLWPLRVATGKLAGVYLRPQERFFEGLNKFRLSSWTWQNFIGRHKTNSEKDFPVFFLIWGDGWVKGWGRTWGRMKLWWNYCMLYSEGHSNSTCESGDLKTNLAVCDNFYFSQENWPSRLPLSRNTFLQPRFGGNRRIFF